MAHGETGGQRSSDILLGPGDGVGEGKSFGQIRRDGAGQRTPRAVGVGGIEARAREHRDFFFGDEDVITGIQVGVMPSLRQDGAAPCF